MASVTLQARARHPLEGHTFLSTFSTVLSHKLHQQCSECKPGSHALGATSIPSGYSSCRRAKPQFSSPSRGWVSSCDLYWAWDRPQGQDLRPQGPMDRVSKTESQGWTRRWKPHLTRRAAPSPPSQIITEGLGGPSGARTSNSYPQKLTVLDPHRNSPNPQLCQVSPTSFQPHMGSLVAPTMQETQVQSLGWEDLLEREMAAHSSIPAWRIPWIEEPGELQATGSHSQDTTHPVGCRVWLGHSISVGGQTPPASFSSQTVTLPRGDRQSGADVLPRCPLPSSRRIHVCKVTPTGTGSRPLLASCLLLT